MKEKVVQFQSSELGFIVLTNYGKIFIYRNELDDKGEISKSHWVKYILPDFNKDETIF